MVALAFILGSLFLTWVIVTIDDYLRSLHVESEEDRRKP